MRLRGLAYVLAALAGLGIALVGVASQQQILRDGFEGKDPVWVKGQADASFQETAHKITEETAYNGKRSEAIQFDAQTGKFIYYHYDTPPAPLTDELSINIWLKANRPGMQLLARLVLPHERDPANLEQRVTMLLPGDTYKMVGNWQMLRIAMPIKLADQQQTLLQAQLKRPVNIADAYVDQLVLNVYGGPGPTQVHIDELDVGPVKDRMPVRQAAQPEMTAPRPSPADLPVTGEVRWDHNQLTIGGKRSFFRIIRHTDTPLKVLRDAGFNAVLMDEATPAQQIDEAVSLGLRIVPVIGVTTSEGQLTSREALGQRVSRFPRPDGVLFWSLGAGGLTQDAQPAVARVADVVRVLDSRPLATDVWEGFQAYARTVDLLGVHRWPLMTTLEFPMYCEWLKQRRLLAQQDVFLWTWVQTHLPDWYVDLVYKQSSAEGFREPIGPQPEQIRLTAMTAVAAGCRGLGFWSDRFLADSHQGQDRLLELALLNQQLQMLEPLLTTAKPPTWADTNVPEVKAAVLRCDRGVLVLPIWMGSGSQYVLGRAAVPNLQVNVPQIPPGMQAWEVGPTAVTGLHTTRDVGGTRIAIREFDLTTAIVFTADNGPDGVLVYFQDQARKMRRLAAQWARTLAAREIDKVTQVEAEMTRIGHPLARASYFLDESRKHMILSDQHWRSMEDHEAYVEARKALWPLRIIMRAQWDEAVRNLSTPVASPFTTSYYTLTRHWNLADRLQHSRPSANVLPDGDFEAMPERAPEAWTVHEMPTLDEVELSARRVTDKPQQGRQCLMLQIKAKNPQNPPGALERTYIAINSPDVYLTPGSLVQVSGWVRVPTPIAASVDGAMFYDSVGDSQLAVRINEAANWKKFTLYREVPASGKIHVTLALTGIGTAYFDDIRIEPLTPQVAAKPAELPPTQARR